ncbi:hypothetical protein Misp06_04426 [Microbulbifer sp. NBRC 101763]|uniref:hypothetical protein n=1 Tax=Microbulbifer sp. NBRC 101763 TaxID=1113820 RepID=UPI0030B0429C
MIKSKLPTEVELIYEVMPCNAMRTAQEPSGKKHACTYFRKWGNYHSYDYKEDGPPAQPGIEQPSQYVGLAPLTPEVLSGCRKSPIMAIGINPNLPGFFSSRKNSVYPLFDDYKQFAHYFRYRSTDKLEIPDEKFDQYDIASEERPPDLRTDLNVPQQDGERTVPLQKQPVTFYNQLQSMLDDMAKRMDWADHKLSVGEDLAYINMVACPSAVWMTRPRNRYPDDLVMSNEETKGIVHECFHHRQYFLRQFFQSLPKIIVVISGTTARAFISEMKDRFIMGDPQVGESINDLLDRKHVLKYGELPDGEELTARVIFSHHITGNASSFGKVREKVLNQMVEEAQLGNVILNETTGHLLRPKGGCVFCPMMEVGVCDYENELVPLSDHMSLTADSPVGMLMEEKRAQMEFIQFQREGESDLAWTEDDEDFQTLDETP